MILTKQMLANSRVARDQWADVVESRVAFNRGTMSLNAMNGLNVNEGLIPKDVYQDFDSVTVERMRSDDGDTYLNDLLALSRSVGIGKVTSKFRQASDAGNAQTSITGQIGVLSDQVEYTYDGTIVPIHDAGFHRNWREWNAMTSEGVDALLDDQRETVATVRRHLADAFLDGHKDKAGNLLVVDGLSWGGMKNDSRVAAIDLGASGINFDFTSSANSGEEIKAALIQIRDAMWIGNKCERDLTYYISREIASNLERKFSAQYDSRTILQELTGLMGIASIKVSSKLSGNELMGFPLSSDSVRPVVGMGLNTVAMPRAVYNANYEFVVWGAIGFEVKTDYFGNTCAFFASELT